MRACVSSLVALLAGLAAPVAAHADEATSASSVQIIVVGNQLLITCDDPQTLALTTEMVRFLVRGLAGSPQIEFIKLRYAGAVEAANLLDQLYNGVRQPATPLPEPGSDSMPVESAGRSRRGAPAVQAVSTEGRIRVIADPATNSLLVWATPIDLLGIRRLLNTVVDVEPSDSGGLMRVWVLPALQNSNAPHVADVLRSVYAQEMGDSAAVARASEADALNARGGSRPRAATGGGRSARPVSLSIGVDPVSNSLVLFCSEKTKESVRELVEQLDGAAKDSPRTVQVVRVDGMDPQLVQRALDAIQGRRSSGGAGSSGGTGIPVIDASPRGSPSRSVPAGNSGLGGSNPPGLSSLGGAP